MGFRSVKLLPLDRSFFVCFAPKFHLLFLPSTAIWTYQYKSPWKGQYTNTISMRSTLQRPKFHGKVSDPYRKGAGRAAFQSSISLWRMRHLCRYDTSRGHHFRPSLPSMWSSKGSVNTTTPYGGQSKRGVKKVCGISRCRSKELPLPFSYIAFPSVEDKKK